MLGIGDTRPRSLAAAMILAATVSIGCRDGTNSPPTKARAEANAAKDLNVEAGDAQRETNAVAYLEALRDDLVAGLGKDVAAAVPPSYRQAISRWGNHWLAIDRETRRHFLESLAQAAETVARKDKLIEGSEILVFDGPWAGVLNTHLAGLARVAAAIARWPGWLASQEDRFNVSGMIDAIVVAIANEPDLREAIKKMEFHAISDRSTNQSVRFRTDSSDPWRTVSMTRVETAWVPTQLIKSLGTAATTDHKSRPGKSPERGQRLHRVANQLDQFASALKEVSTQSEFDQLVEDAVRKYLAKAPARDPGENKSRERPVAAGEFVQVVVSGELSAVEKDQLLWQLARHTDVPANTIATMRKAKQAGSVVIRLGPVSDLQAFAQRLSGLTVENIDEKKRTIKARVSP